MTSPGDIPPALEADFVALRKLRDESECDELKELWSSEDPREWKWERGDIVTVKDGRVTKLIIDECTSLTALPAAIGELKALTTLDLSGCECLDELPDAIGELKALTKLALYECTKLTALPAAIGDLGALTELSLIGCSSLAELPDAIGRLGALTELSLRGCSSLAALPAAIGELKALTTLVLYCCSSLAALPDAIGELKALTKLAFAECTKLTALPAAVGELKALTKLDLSGCSKLSALPDAIGKLGALTRLDLYRCSSLTYPPEEMRGNVHETVGFCCLNLLEGGKVSTADVKKSILNHLIVEPAHDERVDALLRTNPAFADIVKVLKERLELDFATLRKLRNDDASGILKGAWYFEDPRKWPAGFTVENGRVTMLDLRNCPLTALPAAIGELGALTTLDLRGCSSLAALPDAIGELKALTTLDLRGCSSLAALPDAIGELKALTALGLSGCSSLTALPGAIGELGSLTELSMSECSSIVALPAAIGELKALTTLDLRGYSSLAALPDAIGELKALTALGLSGCSSLTALPGAIGELGSLTELSMSECSSIVALPAAIGELKALTTLDLRGCSSLAALPDAIGELKALTALGLSGCSSLTALPGAIGELGSLTELSMSECSSIVALPAAIGELKALTTLYLRSCSSLVALPESIAGLQALEGYDDDEEPNLDLRGCPNLVFPPGRMHEDVDRVKRLLANTTRFLDRKISAADTDEDAKEDFLEIIHHAPFADRLEEAVRKDPALADLTNEKGERAIDLACLDCRRAMQRALFFLGRYDVDKGPPEHRSATSLVVRALDYEAADDYGRLFKAVDDGDETLSVAELAGAATKLGTNVEILKLKDGESYTKDAFVAKCQQLFGKERKVVIKIFQNKEQWRNEINSRKGLDARFVVQTIPAPTDEEFADALPKTDRFGEGVGTHAIVMDAADRNLLQIYQSERPDLNAVRTLMQQVMECVDKVHTQGLVHGDIKMLNVVRLALDHRLRLIDLDAAAAINEDDGVPYVCAKFSSAILPPECFAKLDADQVAQFETYFKGDAESWEEKASPDEKELWEKVAPKVDKRGTSYVVKTFSLTEDGAPKRIDSLPYELVKASEAVDYWSLGALLFQLVTGEPLVPSNRDDDCVDPDEMSKLASWENSHRKRRLALLAKKDPSGKALDLALKLLVRDPDERANFSIAEAIETHPFLNPELMKDGSETLKRMEAKVDAIKADTSIIRSLGEENRIELQRTREVLLKGIFEATEVSTPTAFVILKEKLATKEELKSEPKKFELKLRDDGTGIDVEGTLVDEVDKVKKRYEEAKKWMNRFAKFGKGIAKGNPGRILKELEKTFEELVVGEESFLYLIDELTLEPVRPESEDDLYPIRITEPSKQVAKILPVMQVGLHAASLVNGVSGVAKLFGFPLPSVPEKWREGAQKSVEILKQESSVEAFGAVHEKVQAGDEAAETGLRGEGLRQLKKFFEKEDQDGNYAGLRRIGDHDGMAVWTRVTDPVAVKAALEKRAKERSEEKERSETLLSNLLEKSEKQAGDEPTSGQVDEEPAAPAPASPVPKKEEVPEETQTVSQKQLDDRLDDLEKRLMNKLNTANAGCKCAIA